VARGAHVADTVGLAAAKGEATDRIKFLVTIERHGFSAPSACFRSLRTSRVQMLPLVPPSPGRPFFWAARGAVSVGRVRSRSARVGDQMRQRMDVTQRGDTVRRMPPPGGNTFATENKRGIVFVFAFTPNRIVTVSFEEDAIEHVSLTSYATTDAGRKT
jgi:hypothetical protein